MASAATQPIGRPSRRRTSQVSTTWASQAARCHVALASSARGRRRIERNDRSMAAPPILSRAARRPFRCSGSAVSRRPTPTRATTISSAANPAPMPITSASHPRCVRADAADGGAQDQRRRAQEGEQHLGERSNGDVGDHRRGRLAGGNAARGQQAGAREVAADLGGRQERVHGLADPAQPQRGRPAQPPLLEQRRPGGRVQLDRDDPVEGGSQQRPSASGAEDREHLRRARPGGDEDQQRHPEQAAQGDDPVLPRHRSPLHQ